MPMLQGGFRGVPSAADSLPISVGTATSGRTTSAGDTSSSSEVGCVRMACAYGRVSDMLHDLSGAAQEHSSYTWSLLTSLCSLQAFRSGSCRIVLAGRGTSS